ncbi:MAG: helix-turn-helix domain-containing protein [Acidobacteria bacterium]|nr:helix-turn-helix domain-containing protein [Acidobacteriota bacterium]MCL5288985.1 helix-turn-helix domain-containing protein [Acidobacteriota bacterium]
MASRTKSGKRPVLSTRDLRVISRVISDPRRFQILRHIAAQSCTACSDLRAAFPISAATLSHHLKELESSGLIETTRRGKFVDAVFRRATWEAYLAELQRI